MIPRVYVDTSVIGGCLDEEFAEESRSLMEMANRGQVILLVSDLLARELDDAPPDVRAVLAQLPADAVEKVSMSDESAQLLGAYLAAGVLDAGHTADAHHVALATIAKVDLILSWNFRHIVHVDRIRMFNSVNLRNGYPIMEIRSPKEFV
jgi:hypothetical protein